MMSVVFFSLHPSQIPSSHNTQWVRPKWYPVLYRVPFGMHTTYQLRGIRYSSESSGSCMQPSNDVITGVLRLDRNLICPHQTFKALSVTPWRIMNMMVVIVRKIESIFWKETSEEAWGGGEGGSDELATHAAAVGWGVLLDWNGRKEHERDVEYLFSCIIDALSVSRSPMSRSNW